MLLDKILTKNKIFFILSFLLILVALPRFDKQDKLGVKNYSYKEKLAKKDSVETFSDDLAYVDIVKKLRGDNLTEHAKVPYTYRYFSPYIASILPFKPLTSINVINVIALILTLWFYIQILSHFNFSNKIILYTLLTYVLSFPVFYYSTIGLVDPTIQMWFAISLYFILKNKMIFSIISFLIAITAKESAILIIPMISLSFYYNTIENYKIKNYKIENKKTIYRTLLKSVYFTIILFGLYFLVVYFCRIFSLDQNPSYMWEFKLNNIIGNIVRPRAIISSILSIGITGIIGFLGIIKLKNLGYLTFYSIFYNSDQKLQFNREFNIIILGLISFLVFIIYAFFVIRVSGNYYLPLFTFTIPLASKFLDLKINKS